ncbi:hypothetical protein RHSP_58640 [Rhizobium freirei PRF 81]|uniref:Uncharacterized protein n=1 Tax=Rhizobium freirei PRF 81 TaxID=363754 RepID=N6TX22_9HYPH|nr:hypothetical protein [Rhizobium freirei]ENN84969.1 hypothetical protein RHSP_58640 [Rhizobium freirei PRF 81]
MRPFLLFPFLVLLAPFSAAAAETPCADLVNGSEAIQHRDGFAVSELHDGCAVTNGLFKSGSRLGWTFERAEMKGDDLVAFLKAINTKPDNIPSWGRFSVEGIRFTPLLDNAFANYIATVQQWPMDISGSFHFEPKDGYLDIQEMQLTNLRLGKASLSAEFTLPKNSNVQALAEGGSAGLTHLRFRLDNQGLFEGMAVPSLASFLQQAGGSDDPAQGINQLRDNASTALQILPDSQIDADSKKALLRFLQDLPHPTGFFTLDLAFSKPLQIGSLGLDATQLAQTALASAKISVSYKAR